MNTILENPLMPRLSVKDSKVCEGKLKIEECVKNLNAFESNKSPGNGGWTVQFYIFFWNIVGELLGLKRCLCICLGSKKAASVIASETVLTMPGWWAPRRVKQLSIATTAQVTWLCARVQ